MLESKKASPDDPYTSMGKLGLRQPTTLDQYKLAVGQWGEVYRNTMDRYNREVNSMAHRMAVREAYFKEQLRGWTDTCKDFDIPPDAGSLRVFLERMREACPTSSSQRENF